MKRRSRSVAIPWNTFLLSVITEKFPDICKKLRDMITDVQEKRNKPALVDYRTMPIARKLASERDCQLNDEKKTVVANQLREVDGMSNISLMKSELFVQIGSSVVSMYPSGRDGINYISSAGPFTPYLAAARTTLSLPTRAGNILLTSLMKLAT